jgi:hypothetical protein
MLNPPRTALETTDATSAGPTCGVSSVRHGYEFFGRLGLTTSICGAGTPVHFTGARCIPDHDDLVTAQGSDEKTVGRRNHLPHSNRALVSQ